MDTPRPALPPILLPILLTGASGKLGRAIAPALARHGWTLRLTDIVPFPDALPPGARSPRRT